MEGSAAWGAWGSGAACSHNCGYCGTKSYWYCATCATNGYGSIAVCGPKCTRGCRKQHANGEPIQHGSWSMSEEGRAAVKRARQERGEDADDEDDDEPMGPISPSVRRTGRGAGTVPREQLSRALD